MRLACPVEDDGVFSRRLTLNTEHLAQFQSSAANFAERPDDSFSVGFREEGARIQNGFFIP